MRERTDLLELYNATADGPALRPSWNVAPTQQVYGAMPRPEKDQGPSGRLVKALRWGLVPFWATSPAIGTRMINARVETLASKPAFRRAFAKRRLVAPAEGYYEWQPVEQDGKVRKQPYYIHPAADGGVLSFASLYELWPDPLGYGRVRLRERRGRRA